MADLGAIKAIVATQAKMAREKGQAANLPGLNYTHQQIMLINAAQVNNIRCYIAFWLEVTYQIPIGLLRPDYSASLRSDSRNGRARSTSRSVW